MKIKRLLLLKKVVMYSFYGLLTQIFICTLVLASGVSNAQKAVSVRETVVNINFENDNLISAFQKIERKTDLTFSYFKRELDKGVKINGKYENAVLYDVLLNISKTSNLSFRQFNKKISVSKLLEDTESSRDNVLVATEDDVQISGKVTDQNGNGLPGSSVLIKGTSKGTTTDLDGNYKLEVPVGETILVYSFIGYVSQEVEIGTQAVIDIVLFEDATQLSEVVVTAIGIERETKSLGYSVTQVGSDDLVKGQSASVISSMQGKVPGAVISGSSGAPGSSSKVILRGFSTISGSNNPLYVIDGVPMNNSFNGTNPVTPNAFSESSLNGQVDFGSRANDVSPEDIESVTVLKGAAATALYGSRAGAGAIIITTKKGKNTADLGKGAEVTYSSSMVFENVLKLPDFQNERGQGFFGALDPHENTSWGPEFDGELHLWGNVVDNQQRLKPYVGLPNNVREFFDIGKTLTNTISLQGGNDASNFYLSYSNVSSDGIMPTDADTYDRNTVAIRGATKLNNNITASASVNYARSKISFVPTGQGQSVFNNVLQTPRDISLLEIRDINSKFDNPQTYYSPFTDNPYYVLENFDSDATIDRFYGNFELTYKPLDWISITERLGTDVTRTEWEEVDPRIDITGINASNSNPGNYIYKNLYRREINSDLLVTVARDFSEDFSFIGILGWNINQREARDIFTQINDLVIPGFNNLSNTANTPLAITDGSIRRGYGIYSSLDLGFRDYLFLSVTARNDWSSTLPPDNNTFFYPGMNVGYVFTEHFNINNKIISFGKVRAAWGQVGSDAKPFVVNSVFTTYQGDDGFVNLNSPINQSVPAFTVGNRIGNPALQPEISTEIEFGAQLNFLDDRIGLDFTYYKRDINENILNVPLTPSSGFTSQTVNIGKIQNKGIELQLTGTPLRTPDFRWDISLNWSRNRGKVIDLGGPDQISLGGLNGTALIARVGGPTFEIEGSVPLLDGQGNPVVDAAGLPVENPVQEVIGSTQYNWVGGVSNNLTYKGVSLSFTFDVRTGGSIYSRTADLGYFAGTTPETLYNDRRPFIVPNSVTNVGTDENGNPIYEENTVQVSHHDGTMQAFWDAGGFNLDRSFLVKKDFVKLRELVLAYSLPSTMLERTPFGSAQISFIGRNLLLWLPQDNQFIDPEVTSFGNDIESEFGDFGATPTTRSYGVNLRFTF